MAKVDRAKASLDRHSKRLRQFRGTTEETIDEKSFRTMVSAVAMADSNVPRLIALG